MSNGLQLLHNTNKIYFNKKEYEGTETTVIKPINSTIEFKIYGYTYQDKDLFSDIVSLSNLILKVESKDKSFSTNIPYIGNAIEADYIHYNPNTNTAKRYKVIDENLIDYSIPLIDQFQAFLSEPVIEDIEMTMDEYFFENIKSIQDECKISLNSI